MFDRRIQPLQKRLLEPPPTWLAQRGASADAVTIFGFVVGLAVVPLLAYGQSLRP